MSPERPAQPGDPKPRRPNPSIPEKKRSSIETWQPESNRSGGSTSKPRATTGKFVLKKGSTGRFRFALLDFGGRVVVTSEAYETKAEALRAVRALKQLAPVAAVEYIQPPAPKASQQRNKAAAKAAQTRKKQAGKAAPLEP